MNYIFFINNPISTTQKCESMGSYIKVGYMIILHNQSSKGCCEGNNAGCLLDSGIRASLYLPPIRNTPMF